jgi:hypothetical protein
MENHAIFMNQAQKAAPRRHARHLALRFQTMLTLNRYGTPSGRYQN